MRTAICFRSHQSSALALQCISSSMLAMRNSDPANICRLSPAWNGSGLTAEIRYGSVSSSSESV